MIQRMGTERNAARVASVLLLLCFWTAVLCQPALADTVADAVPPDAIAPGAPAGAYQLSGFEQINVNTGHASIVLPLLNVGGRGQAGYTISLPIGSPQWVVETATYTQTAGLVCPQCAPGDTGYGLPLWQDNYVTSAVTTDEFQGFIPLYSPGVAFVKYSAANLMKTADCNQTTGAHLQQGFTYISFVTPDGTEHQLYAPSPNGGVKSYQCGDTEFVRGDTFVATDGSGIIFKSHGNDINKTPIVITDHVTLESQDTGPFETADGHLMMPDGTRYEVAGGYVQDIYDRNGNHTVIAYNTVPTPYGVAKASTVQTITDPLGRTINFAYDLTNDPNFSHYDTITFKGTANADRQIKIGRKLVRNALRNPPGGGSVPPAFPELSESCSTRPPCELYFEPADWEVPTSVILPNQQTYRFLYNNYGEIARVELPTGGAIEYDHGAGLTPIDSSKAVYASGQVLSDLAGVYSTPSASPDIPGLTDTGAPVVSPKSAPWRPYIYRRLTARRMYPDGVTLASTTTYSQPEAPGTASFDPDYPALVQGLSLTNAGYTQVMLSDNTGAGSTVTEQHYFFGRQRPDGSGGYIWDGPAAVMSDYSTKRHQELHGQPASFTSKEYKTEFPNLRREEKLWGFTDLNVGAGVELGCHVCQVNTTLLDGTAGTSRKMFHYDALENVTDTYEYGYSTSVPPLTIDTSYVAGPCPQPLLGYSRHTHTDFKSDTNYIWGQYVHLWNLPILESVKDGNDNLASQTTYVYDGGGLASHGAVTGHDNTNFGTGYTVRGNLTTLTRNISSSASVTTSSGYDDLGNVVTSTDGNGNLKTITYTAPDYAFPKTVSQTVDSVLHQQTMTYDASTGKLTTFKDSNNAQTTLYYSGDLLDRLTQVTRPDTGTTSYTYDPAGQYVVAKSDLSSSQQTASRVLFDGLGRQVETRVYENGSETSTAYISTQRQYDGIGRLWKVSNPYRPNSSESLLWTTTTYDALGRATRVTTPDEAHTDTSYAGNQTTVTDPAGKDRKAVTDALGRLTDVYENPTGLNYHTQYQYDPLDDLTTVSQGGQTRSFTYDWLKRLQSAQNPESGTVNYTQYDNNGNLLSKTDARGVTTTMTYDGLNRIRSKAYSGGAAAATPAVTYCYDGKLAGATDGVCNNPSITNAIGRLTQVSSTASKTAYSAFDTMGRVTSSSQTTGGQTYAFPVYAYNLAGALTSMTYPSGRVVNTGYDGAGRANQLGTATDATAYVSSVQYASHGAARQIALHNGVIETTTFNTQRLQPAAISAGSLALNYYYCPSGGTSCTSNNGNLLRQTIGTGAINVTQDYGYDGVNRLTSAGEGANWSRGFGYDAFGNMWLTAASGVTVDTFTPNSANWYNANNRLVNAGMGIAYDAGGNLQTIGAYNLTYDGENRQVAYTNGGVTTNYSYDGEGRRVMKTQGTTTTYVYDAAGQLAAEYSAQPNQSPCATCYLTADHLGSTRMMTDASGAVKSLHDFLPFGEEVPATVGGRSGTYYPASALAINDAISQKFTGKERDAETGLDYFGARYMSAAQGRFTSPDPSLVFSRLLTVPQRWNRYAYVINNPLTRIDPDGAADFAVFDAFRNSDLKSGQRPNWAAIKSAAERRGHHVSIYSIEAGAATKAAFQKAVSTPGMNVIEIGHSVEVNNTAVGSVLSDGAVGSPNFTSNGVPMTPPNGVAAASVDIFGCNSTNLLNLYSGAATFTGVNSGPDAMTNSLTLEAAGAAFLTSATSMPADQSVDLDAAAGAAQSVISNSTQTTPLAPGAPAVNIDKDDKVCQDGECY